MKRIVLLCCCLLFFICLHAVPAFANKASVSIDDPGSVAKGSEVTIKLTVTHTANSFFHYTNWLKVYVDGKPAGEWIFTAGNRPEAAVFTRDIKIKVMGPTEVTAEANCNIHGSAGPAKLTIKVLEPGTKP